MIVEQRIEVAKAKVLPFGIATEPVRIGHCRAVGLEVPVEAIGGTMYFMAGHEKTNLKPLYKADGNSMVSAVFAPDHALTLGEELAPYQHIQLVFGTPQPAEDNLHIRIKWPGLDEFWVDLLIPDGVFDPQDLPEGGIPVVLDWTGESTPQALYSEGVLYLFASLTVGANTAENILAALASVTLDDLGVDLGDDDEVTMQAVNWPDEAPELADSLEAGPNFPHWFLDFDGGKVLLIRHKTKDATVRANVKFAVATADGDVLAVTYDGGSSTYTIALANETDSLNASAAIAAELGSNYVVEASAEYDAEPPIAAVIAAQEAEVVPESAGTLAPGVAPEFVLNLKG